MGRQPAHGVRRWHRRAARAIVERLVQSGGRSRMADFTEVMTVRQLVDVVAFLQSRYDVQPPVPAAQ